MRTPHLLIEEVFHHMYSTLLLDITGNLATLTLNRPEKRNAISTQMMAELQTALDHIEKSHARVALFDVVERGLEFRHHLRGNRVALFRPVQREGGEVSGDVQKKCFVHGSNLHRCARSQLFQTAAGTLRTSDS